MHICGYYCFWWCCNIMKLHLKRDVSAGDACFSVFDESGAEKFRAVQVSTKVTKRTNLILLDNQGNTAAKIRRLPIVGTCTFVLKVGRAHITFVIVPTKNGILSNFYGNNWHINGSIAAKDFTVSDVDNTVILSHRRHADHCTLEIFDPENELYCIAVSVCANLINTIEKPVVKTANI